MNRIGTQIRNRVFDLHGREITIDDERQVVPHGGRVTTSVMLMDSTQQGEAKMTVMVDGKEMSADDVTRTLQGLQGQIAAQDAVITELKSQVPVVDAAIAARDAARLRARDSLLAQQAAKHNIESAHGAYVSKLRDSWKSGQSWR